jgi:predicted small integral membrane protein
MPISRYAKIVMSLALAAFCLLVTFDNLTDYGTNYLFVQHVMSMDTTFPGNALMYRAITNPVLWQLAYALIIAAEGITGILFLAGAIRLIQVRNAPAPVFNEAKSLVIAAAMLAFLVWFFGFMVVAASGSPCGSRRPGTARRPPFASIWRCSAC